MTLETRLFGSIEYDEEDVITFPAGLPSFENEHKFLLLPIAGSDATLLCLQSMSTPALSFIVMDPFSLDPTYMPVLSPAERTALGVERDLDLCFYVLCAMKRPVPSSTVNLRCPVALNPDSNIAYQVILESDVYQMRHSLSEFSKKEEAGSC